MKSQFLIPLVWIVVLMCATTAHSKNLYDLNMESLQSGERIALQDYQGKIVLLSFFEPECTWCYRQMKAFNRIQEHCDHSVQPIAVGINGKPQRLQKEIRKAKIQYPALRATSELLNQIGEIPATPWTLVTDPQGTVLGHLRGYIPEPAIRKILGNACPENN
ncbi:TlpA disulfide reductase family protein [Teredinibacter sp. KSP-S5-2]|uniref:TlpA family protein disulfide reductase n=1 Tax=Teredinibacter sp. KSP-S5-2 TaxID=3034506 RepID=UPI0029351B5E|nr:TlpA disulfide reductase family protein [Teredinibacter sp. KSP-S5-2]WNO08495.1 TlpA disulfide reductase family protein [Teredinibacter sp. KSP-S5-2]